MNWTDEYRQAAQHDGYDVVTLNGRHQVVAHGSRYQRDREALMAVKRAAAAGDAVAKQALRLHGHVVGDAHSLAR